MRPIDADVVQEHLNELMNNEYCDPDFKKTCFCLSIYLDDVPTLEAEPVKHGKWLDTRNISYSARCNVCGRYATDIMPYCPNCGAKMDGIDENE